MARAMLPDDGMMMFAGTCVLGLAGLVACGGGTTGATVAAASPPVEARAPAAEREPGRAFPADSRKRHAKAALTPVKDTKLQPMLVSFSQSEGDETRVEADALKGVKPGTYWLVVHAGTSCGPNATKAGPPQDGLEANLKIVIDQDLTGALDTHAVLPFDGDRGIVGHVLVLHESKSSTPGKALACGLIEEVEDP